MRRKPTVVYGGGEAQIQQTSQLLGIKDPNTVTETATGQNLINILEVATENTSVMISSAMVQRVWVQG